MSGIRALHVAPGAARAPRATADGIALAGVHARGSRLRNQLAREVARAGVELQNRTRRGADRLEHALDQHQVAGAPHLREAARRHRQRRAAALGDVDLGLPRERLAANRQADHARIQQAIRLAARERGAAGVELADVDVHTLGAGLQIDLGARGQPRRERAHRGQRRIQRRREQRAGGHVDDLVRSARAKPDRPRRLARPYRQLRAVAITERRPGGDDRARLRSAPARARRWSSSRGAAPRCRRAATGNPRSCRTDGREAGLGPGRRARRRPARPRRPAPFRAPAARARARPARPAARTPRGRRRRRPRRSDRPRAGGPPRRRPAPASRSHDGARTHLPHGNGCAARPRSRSKSKRP